MPDSITTYGESVFKNCSYLRSINYPASLTSVNTWGSIFNGCKRLRTIVIPEGVTVLPAKVFLNCNYLRNVVLPSTLVTIGTSAFQDCVRLRSVEILEGVTTVQSEAFKGCTNLETIYLPGTVTSYGNGVFTGCTSLVVECKEYSFAAVYCIDNNIPVEFIRDSFEDETGLILDRERTYYVTNAAGAMSNGYVTMNLGYGVKEEVADSVSNLKLTIRMSPNASLLAKTLRLDGEVIEDIYSDENVDIGDFFDSTSNILAFDLTKTSGQLSFCLRPDASANITTYALLTYTRDGVTRQEIIGCLNEKSTQISIQASPEVNTQRVRVTGAAPAGQQVGLYVDGVLNTTAYVKASGTYEAYVTLPNVADYTVYKLTAKAVDASGATISAGREVRYVSDLPALNKFLVSYGKNTYNAMDVNNQRPLITYEGTVWNEEWAKFGFEVSFEDNSLVEDVYVCSTRNGVTKRMQASWDENKQAFTVRDMFEPGNPYYVPGKLTVEYTQPAPELDFNKGVDFTSARYVNAASDVIKNALNKKADEYLNVITNTDDLLQGTITLTDVDAALDFNVLTEMIPEYLNETNAAKYGYQVMKDDAGYQLYLKVAEIGEDKVRAEIIDFGKETLVDFLVEGRHASAAMDVESFFAFGDALGYADTMITWDNNRISLKDAKQSILASSMSPAEKAAALQKIDYAERSNHGVVACMGLQILLAAAGIAIPFPCSMVLPLIALQNSSYVDGVLGEFGYLEGESILDFFLDPKYKIDPSGYVYDLDTNERIQGAIVTAYWMSYEQSDEETQPAANVYGTKWDASEWEQSNPLVTDEDGRYAWDVPEGWWRVKVEHPDYETVWSEWLPVPPPQTEVNLGMKCTAAGTEYQFAVEAQTDTSVQVSLTNGTDGEIKVQYILAAYDTDGKLVTSDQTTVTLGVGDTAELDVDFALSDNVDLIKGFVLDSTTLNPLRGAGQKPW